MPGKPWFRLYAEMADDPKAQELPPVLFKHWINLLCLACRNDGVLPNIQRIAFGLRCSEAEATGIVATLSAPDRGLLDLTPDGYMPHNWRGRQFESDTSTERVRAHRMKRSRNVTVTADETDQRQIQSRTELTTPNGVVAPAEPVAVPTPPTPAPATPPAARSFKPVPKPKERDQSWIERHPLFPALVAIPEIGRPAGDRWSLYGKALKTLDELGATPDQVPRCAENYPLVMGTKADGTPIPLTLTGLMNNWNLCRQAPAIRRQGGNRVDDLGPTQDDRRRAEERQRADAAAYRAALGLNGAGAASELVAGRLSRLPGDGGA